jgi:hypothetical protein
MRIRLERFKDELASPRAFGLRFACFSAVALVLIAGMLTIGVLGYHWLERLSWLDALLNASMILGGMGPVNELRTDAGKLFASGYALLSGLMILAAAGVVATPVVHRFLHWFHMPQD